MCNSYNGCANYPTWLVGLWIDNSAYLQSLVAFQAEKFYADDKPSWEFGDWLKEYILDMLPEANEANMLADLLGYSLDMVGWQEIAEGYYQDLEAQHANDDLIESEDES